MSNWQQQIIDNATAIQQIINGAKNIHQFNPILGSLSLDDEVGVWSIAESKTVKIKIRNIVDFFTSGWLNIEGSEVKKAAGNSNINVLEHLDTVRFKLVTNENTTNIPVMIMYGVYDETLDSADKESENSYTIPSYLL